MRPLLFASCISTLLAYFVEQYCIFSLSLTLSSQGSWPFKGILTLEASKLTPDHVITAIGCPSDDVIGSLSYWIPIVNIDWEQWMTASQCWGCKVSVLPAQGLKFECIHYRKIEK